MPESSLLLITYDVSNDRRRVRLHKLLTGFGVQVQESVFECDLDDHARTRLMRKIRLLAGPGDNIRIYPICDSCQARIQDAQGNLRPAPPEVYFG